MDYGIHREILDDVGEWLRFAEAKNAALAAMCGLTVWGATRVMLLATQSPTSGATWFSAMPIQYWYSLMAFALAALTSALISFMPVLKVPAIVPRRKKEARSVPNVLYFGDLAPMRRAELAKVLADLSRGDGETAVTELDHQFAAQIIINSRIALRKYGFFDLSVALLLCALLTPIVALALVILARISNDNLWRM